MNETSSSIRPLSRGHTLSRPKSISPSPTSNSQQFLNSSGESRLVRTSSPGIVRPRHIVHHQPNHHVLYNENKLTNASPKNSSNDSNDDISLSPLNARNNGRQMFRDKLLPTQGRPSTAHYSSSTSYSNSSKPLVHSASGSRLYNVPKIPVLNKTPLEKLGELTQASLSSRFYKKLTCSVTAMQNIPRNFVFNTGTTPFTEHTEIYNSISRELKTEKNYATMEDIKKSDLMYNVFKDILLEFRNYEHLLETSGPGIDSQVAKTVSYGHPEDLFQICCFLYCEKIQADMRNSELLERVKMQEAQIAEFIAEKESATEYDLFKVRPSQRDLDDLEVSLANLKENISKEDPLLMQEIMIMRENQKDLENRLQAQKDLQIYEQYNLQRLHADQSNSTRSLRDVSAAAKQDSAFFITGDSDQEKLSSPSARTSKVPVLAPLKTGNGSSELKLPTVSKSSRGLVPTTKNSPKNAQLLNTQRTDFSEEAALDDELSDISVGVEDLPVDADGVKYYIKLMKDKLKLLEDFVMVMKKKNSRVEQKDEDLKSLLNNFGSLESLLRENERLRKELKFYNWATKRFDHDLLLKHEYLYLEDLPLLRSVIFALQNELFCLQQQLKFYNLEENTTLKLQIIQSNPEVSVQFSSENEKLHDLDYLMTEIFMDEKRKEEFLKKKQVKQMLAKEMDGKSVNNKIQEEMDFRNNLKKSESENEALRAQTHRDKQEIEALKKTISILSESNATSKRTDVKERETIIKKLHTKIEKLSKACSTKENNHIFQEELSKALGRKNSILVQQNANLSEQNLVLRQNVKELRSKISVLSQGMQTMYLLCNSMAYSLLSESIEHLDSNFQIPKLTQKLYRDMFRTYTVASRAAVKIQSWMRGIQTRKKLLKNGFYLMIRNKSPKPSQTTLVSEAQISEQTNIDGYPQLKQFQRSDTFTRLYDFLKVIMAVTECSEKLNDTRALVQLVRAEVVSKLKNDIQCELAKMKHEMDQHAAQLSEAVLGVANIPKIARSTQTTTLQTRERSIQCGVTQLTHVEIR